MPSVSVIATVLNENHAIDQLVQSLLRQSMLPGEIIIVDGGSTDGTWERLREHAAANPLLHPILDESCSLAHSRGPIARGRNVAIAAARGDWIACCDAGCSYGPDWLARLVEPMSRGADYVLGGSCVDPSRATVWDIAAAPLMGIAIGPEGIRKSCTARSMGFTKEVWKRVAGFPEDTLLGEDTVFDLRVQALTPAAYAEGAMAVYEPQFTYESALSTLARYSAADGALGIRRPRFLRMALRCLSHMVAVGLVPWSWWPLALVLIVEMYFAVERDVSVLKPSGWKALIPRLAFSLSVPWVTAFNYLRGAISKSNLPNQQNANRK